MTSARNIAAKMRATTSRLLPRRMRSAKGPSDFGHKKKEARERLDDLERWSGRATLIIFFGIVFEVASLWMWPHDFRERVWLSGANALVGIGLIIEYAVILRAIVASGEVQREADKNVAEALKVAGEAHERAANAELKIERLKLPRFVSDEQHKALVEGLKHVSQGAIYLRPGTHDAEAIVYGEMFKKAFGEAGRELSPYPGITPVSWNWSGLWLQMRDKTKPPKHAEELWNCLKAAGFDVPWWGNDEQHPEDGVTLGIGSKV